MQALPQREIVRKMSVGENENVAMHAHLHFVDFEQFGRRNPAYFNTVRDPVDRQVQVSSGLIKCCFVQSVCMV